MNWEIPEVKAGFRKVRGTRDQIAQIHWIVEIAREFQKKKKSTSASLAMLKPSTLYHNKPWKTLTEMRIPDHLTQILRNLYVGQEPTVRIVHGTNHKFKIGKGEW